MILHHNLAVLHIVLFFIYMNKIASTDMQQRNVRVFKENLKEQKSPFFVRCFLKVGIVIFILILASASIF